MSPSEQSLADNKMRPEIAKISSETIWYPVVIMSAAVAATATIVKLFFT